jgi:hypothetical protein
VSINIWLLWSLELVAQRHPSFLVQEVFMQKWEYKMLRGWPTEVELNRLGAEGWELVSVAVSAESAGVDEYVAAYLKRNISE